jgi:hypothetical protein
MAISGWQRQSHNPPHHAFKQRIDSGAFSIEPFRVSRWRGVGAGSYEYSMEFLELRKSGNI